MSEVDPFKPELTELEAVANQAAKDIGPSDTADGHLSREAHAQAIAPFAFAFRQLLTNDEEIKEAERQFSEEDKRACWAQARVEFWLVTMTLLAVAPALLVVLLISVPLKLSWGMALTLSIAIALTLGFLAHNSFRYIRSRTRKLGSLGNGMSQTSASFLRLVIVAALTLLFFVFLVPNNLHDHERILQLVSMVLILIALVLVYRFGAGSSRQRSVLRDWHVARTLAENKRRIYFEKVLTQAAGAAEKERDSPLLSHALEYVRRFQLQGQCDYYAMMGERDQNGADHTDATRRYVFWAFVVTMIVFVLISFSTLAEQVELPRWLGFLDAIAPPLIAASRHGIEDIALACALILLGMYAIQLVRSSVLNQRRNAARYFHALSDVSRLIGSQSAEFNTKSGLELDRARLAAAASYLAWRNGLDSDAKGKAWQVVTFFHTVNEVFARETASWTFAGWHSIAFPKSGQPRLISSERLGIGSYELIWRDVWKWSQRVTAGKTGLVSARKAEPNEEVITWADGKVETTATANPGDWVVTNMNAEGGILRNEGRENSYVVPGTRFLELYRRDEGSTEFGDVYKAPEDRRIEAIRLDGGFDIAAPWGERQTGDSGWLVKNGNDIYGVTKSYFADTYTIVAKL